MREERLYTSVWIPPELQDSPILKVVEHYVAQGWTVCDVTACDMSLKDSAVMSMVDLTPEQSVECGRRLPTDKWVIKVELDKGGVRRNNRTVRFAYSSVPAQWLEHPIEIEAPVVDETMDRPFGKHEPREMKMVLEELASLSEAALASWAMVSSIHGAPSVRELLQGIRPTYVDLITVFLSELEFDEHALSGIPRYAHQERWAAGWLWSVHPYWGLSMPEQDVSGFEKAIWRLLSSWSHRQRRW